MLIRAGSSTFYPQRILAKTEPKEYDNERPLKCQPETCPLYPHIYVDFVDNLYTAKKCMTGFNLRPDSPERKCVDEQISLCYIKVTMERSFFYALFSVKELPGH